MTDIILTAIIIVLLGGFGWYIREQEKVKTKLINAILAKDSNEYINRTLAENTKIEPEINAPQNPELIPFDQANEEQFDAHIQATLGNDLSDQEIV